MSATVRTSTSITINNIQSHLDCLLRELRDTNIHNSMPGENQMHS